MGKKKKPLATKKLLELYESETSRAVLRNKMKG